MVHCLAYGTLGSSTGERVLPAPCLTLFFDFFQRVEFSAVATRTRCGCCRPSVRRKKILRPEGPRSALNWTVRINPATSGLVAQQNAVAVGVFFQRPLFRLNRPDEHLFKH